MDPVTSVTTCLSKYATFSGRASRPEFWWFTLAASVLYLVLAFVPGGEALSTVASLVLLLPTLAVGARRLHDTGRSGWWQLLAFIPFVGIVVLIVFWASAGQHSNAYGPPTD